MRVSQMLNEGETVYTIGIDYGTESRRALLVDAKDGSEIATAVHPYSDGVIDHALPDGTPLPCKLTFQCPFDRSIMCWTCSHG